ncbi:hypothetical protein M413DRAFT_24835 [Hebeloma cylindrosporum]|uniref:Uncharacterized protein n=1 Tax=Hebeloma cylindrosporum TaxID=76867 RepID=A0A0C3CA56_HEBCY|nr:hypothetical protein M413DRAFT_24835 [Hebeloma cylindrosporum h7]
MATILKRPKQLRHADPLSMLASFRSRFSIRTLSIVDVIERRGTGRRACTATPFVDITDQPTVSTSPASTSASTTTTGDSHLKLKNARSKVHYWSVLVKLRNVTSKSEMEYFWNVVTFAGEFDIPHVVHLLLVSFPSQCYVRAPLDNIWLASTHAVIFIGVTSNTTISVGVPVSLDGRARRVRRTLKLSELRRPASSDFLCSLRLRCPRLSSAIVEFILDVY